MHPNKVVEAKLMEGPVKFTPVKVETAKEEVLEVKRIFDSRENPKGNWSGSIRFCIDCFAISC